MTLLAVDFRLKKAENNSTMPSTVINDIEREFAQLSREVQLSLLERLLRHVRLSETGPNDTWEAELSEMAADSGHGSRWASGRLMAVQRGEIYLVNLNPAKGREQAGQRPVLVISVDAINQLPLVVTVIVGTKGENVTRDYKSNARISSLDSGLPMETVFLGFQIRSLDPSRLVGRAIGRLSASALEKVENAVRHCLGL